MIKTCPPYDQATHRPIPGAFDETPDGTGGIQLVQRIDPIPLDEIKATHKAAASAHKKVVETGGLVLGAMTIATNRESQGMVGGAYSAAKAGTIEAFDFKGTDGWHTVPADLMVIVGEAVARHVQTCFSRERAIHEAIDAAADATAVLAIDIGAGWPDGTAADPAATVAYRALIQRQADALAESGDVAASLALLQKEKML